MFLDNDHDFIRIAFLETFDPGHSFLIGISIFVWFDHSLFEIIIITSLQPDFDIQSIAQHIAQLLLSKIQLPLYLKQKGKIKLMISQLVMQNDISIIYHKYCPYAHRALLVALEKDVNAKFISTGLGRDTRSQLFTDSYAHALGRDLQSKGKVPILIHNGQIITESQLVCWYLAQSFTTGTQLISEDKMKRAMMRVWISQINTQMITLFDRAKTKQIGMVQEYLKELQDFMLKVDASIQGPYLLGGQVSLADILIYPWFERWAIVEHYFQFPIPSQCQNIKSWMTTMSKRPSVAQTRKLTTDEYYIKRTNRMIEARAKL